MNEDQEKDLVNQFAMLLSMVEEEPEPREKIYRPKEGEILAEWETVAGYSAIVLDNKRGNPLGFICGYVMVPKGHPYHGVWYAELYGKVETKAELSYAREGVGGCWVIGFDCGSYGTLDDLKEAAEEVALSLAQATKQLPAKEE